MRIYCSVFFVFGRAFVDAKFDHPVAYYSGGNLLLGTFS